MVEAFMIPKNTPEPFVEAAERALDERRVLAGRDYLAALRRLGLDPDVLCWVYAANYNEMQLIVVTSIAERVDSLSIYKLLFHAYEAAATPAEIDPFIVSVYGPKSEFGIQLRQHLGGLSKRGLFSDPEKAGSIALTNYESSDPKIILGRGVYVATESYRSASEDLKRWRHFQQRAEALAA